MFVLTFSVIAGTFSFIFSLYVGINRPLSDCYISTKTTVSCCQPGFSALLVIEHRVNLFFILTTSTTTTSNYNKSVDAYASTNLT